MSAEDFDIDKNKNIEDAAKVIEAVFDSQVEVQFDNNNNASDSDADDESSSFTPS